MTLSANDPRLTAYALGELDQHEAVLLEAELGASPDGKRALAEIRHLTGQLAQALSAEPGPTLPPSVREMILATSAKLSAHNDQAVTHSRADKYTVRSVRPAMTNPSSPALHRTVWLRRHSRLLTVCGVLIFAAALVLPGIRPVRESDRKDTIAKVEFDPSQQSQATEQVLPHLRYNVNQTPPAEDPAKANPEQIAVIVDQFNQLIEAQRYEEAEVLATKAELDSPDDSVVRQLSLQAKFAQRLARSKHKTTGPATGHVEVLKSVDVGTQSGEPALSGAVPSEKASQKPTYIVSKPVYENSTVRTRQWMYLANPSQRNRVAGGGQNGAKNEVGAYRIQTFGEKQNTEGVDKRYNLATTHSYDPPAQTAPADAKVWDVDDVLHIGLPGAANFGLSVALKDNNAAVMMVRPRIIIQEEEEAKLAEGRRGSNTETYDSIVDNPFQSVAQQPLSTFSIDVDTASYANVRRFLNQGTLPPPGAVRIEEMLNYFRYGYEGPKDAAAEKPKDTAAEGLKDTAPFAAHTDVAACPWAPQHRLVRIALKAREIAVDSRPASNLVFLVDVSGSMQDQNKLPLVKEGLRLLVEKLGENDRVAIVVYAGASGLVLPSTLGTHKDKILYAIDQLEAGGSTNGAAGIQLAYDTAVGSFIKGGANRVILATDGDFNVGISDQSQLVGLIEKKATSGVFLSVLGFGMGNLKDSNLEKLADKGNGNYAYIDSPGEARKVLVEELSGTLVTVAKDVKIQIEFNPAKVQAYRLLGYENRVLAKEDFNDDKKDAGEIGAGHTVTALYEVTPAGVTTEQPRGVDKLEYQAEATPRDVAARSDDLLTLKLRYKEPEGTVSRLLKFRVADKDQEIGVAGDDFEFAAAVAAFGMLLRHSAHKGAATFPMVLEIAQGGLGADHEGYRHEFIELVKKAQQLLQ